MFITLDGIDGAGKSTQIALLGDWLASQGHAVAKFRDPGSTKLGEAVREILLHREDIPLANTAEMLLYMSARAQLVAEQIRPALERNETVICDRFLLSNVVYQGCAGGLAVDELWLVGNCATQGLVPDICIVLDLEPELAFTRIQRGHDRLEKRGVDYFRLVRNGFLSQASRAGRKSLIVDATQTPMDVHSAIKRFLSS